MRQEKSPLKTFPRRSFLASAVIGFAAASGIGRQLATFLKKSDEFDKKLYVEWQEDMGVVLPELFAKADNPQQPWVNMGQDGFNIGLNNFALMISADFSLTENRKQIILTTKYPSKEKYTLDLSLEPPSYYINRHGVETVSYLDPRMLTIAADRFSNDQSAKILIVRKSLIHTSFAFPQGVVPDMIEFNKLTGVIEESLWPIPIWPIDSLVPEFPGEPTPREVFGEEVLNPVSYSVRVKRGEIPEYFTARAFEKITSRHA